MFEKLAMQGARASSELDSRKLIGRSCRSRGDVRGAKVQLEEQVIVEAGEESWSEPSGEQRGPESIPGSAEVVTDRRRIETGIDPTEHDIEARAQKVR
jgi:hypothetical protein